MSYYFATTVDLPFDETVELVTEELADIGFGVLGTVDIQATLREKIDVDPGAYTVIEACNPKFAWEAIRAEDKIGVLLPCNVVVKDGGAGTEVAAVDPIALLKAIDNARLGQVGMEVQELLRDMIERLPERADDRSARDDAADLRVVD